MILFSFSLSFRNGEILGELLVGDCEHILPLNHLIATFSSYIIYTNKIAMRQSGLLFDDNRDVSEACVTRPLVEIANLVSHGHRNYSGSSKRKAMKEMDTTRLKLSGYR